MTEINNNKDLIKQYYIRLGELRERREIIIAKYTKKIWSDKKYDDYDYNQRNKLRSADLTLELSEDSEYNVIHSIFSQKAFQTV